MLKNVIGALLVLLAATATVGVRGQQPDPDEVKSVEARVRPELVPPGAPVTISGPPRRHSPASTRRSAATLSPR
jgi:hypothetical protein